MRDAYSVSKVRAAEAALMAQVPEGTLMQRAAAGLASVCAGLLRDSAGGVYGARVVVLAGTGDNGGDALYAAEKAAAKRAAESTREKLLEFASELAGEADSEEGCVVKLGAREESEEHAAEQGRDYTPRRNRFLEARDDSLQQFRHGNPTILSCYDSTSRGGGI